MVTRPNSPSPVPDIRLDQTFKPPYYEISVDWLLRNDGTLTGSTPQALATADLWWRLVRVRSPMPTIQLPDP